MIEVLLIHCRLADIAVVHGALTLLTGFLLIAMRRAGRYFSDVRILHVTLGLLTALYAALLYLPSIR